MSDFISINDVRDHLKWVITEDPAGVLDILKFGKRIENSHVTTPLFLWDRKKGPKEQNQLFQALQQNRITDENGQVRDFTEWCNYWENIRLDRQTEIAEKRLQKRIARARKNAIDSVRKQRPHQLFVNVIQEESPHRIEEMSDSNSGSSDIVAESMRTNTVVGINRGSELQNEVARMNREISISKDCCPENTNCFDENCQLSHF